ncbi:baculoviral IAP repeat-containing protein 2-like [Ruditapes philippinarum]|uniref:baculoviral IAP repeat-containing protein 2-like n=1 Tax=Ruditapes philippinarum TaxID=129788 RepID=UPI00295B1399|nr:baculoviral IAP repeat-containing protein 2-like [Ruditapes philippinarum]
MAIYGFFYTGRLDLIRCFQCGIGLKDWAGADEPLFEHIKHSPDCSFLKDLLGQDLFIAYRDNLQASQSQQAGNTATTAGSESTAARVRNPQFKEMPARLSSFDKWPTTAQQSPQRLADAGLFYTGMNDLCRCFTCDGGLQRWDADDDPWIEHARWFPQCQYVRQIKGQEYINMVQQAAAQARAEEEDPSVIIPAVAQGAGRTGPVQQGMEDLNLEDNSPLNTYAAHSVIGIGFSRRAVLIAIDEYKRQAAPGKENDYGSTDLVRILRDREARGEALPPDSPMDTYLGATAAVLLPENLDPEEENRRLRDIMKCMVCRENDTNILFLPCTHHRMCEECAEKVQVCPVCDQKISEKIKTYLS